MEAGLIESQSLVNVLLNQSPIVIGLCFVIWHLWKIYLKEKDKKDALAEIVVKTTMLWEERYSKESQDDKDIKEFMKEIREFVKEIRDGKGN